jgi:hypothetical protein
MALTRMTILKESWLEIELYDHFPMSPKITSKVNLSDRVTDNYEPNFTSSKMNQRLCEMTFCSLISVKEQMILPTESFQAFYFQLHHCH